MMGTIYRMFDWGDTPGEWGGYGFERWERLHTGPGEYNWGIIDSWLDKQAGKPCAFSVATHLSQMEGWESFYDATPTWIYDIYDSGRPVMNGRRVGHIVDNAALPAYEDKAGPWWKYLREFVLAFGARYDGDARLTVVFGGPGLDMENNNTKGNVGDANTSYRFGQLCVEFIHWLAEAFPTKRAYYVCTTGQGRLEQAKLAGSLGLGVKNNGLLPDMDSHQGYGAFVGSFDPMAWANENGVPVWIETAHWLSKENMYWSIPACLHYHPAGVDVHSGWFDAMPQEQLDFWAAHVGVTAETTPGAFVVLRDSEYPKRKWTQGGQPAGCSGHVGDWEFYMRRTSPDDTAPRVEDVGPGDAPESRQSRRIAEATFQIELAAGPPYEVTVRWLQEPGVWLQVGNTIFDSSGVDAWDEQIATIDARTFTLTSNNAAVHMLYATAVNVDPEPPIPPDPPEPPPDWAAMTTLLNDAQRCIDAARADLDDATAELAELRAMMAEEAE